MSGISDKIQNHSFLSSLLEAIPCGVLVLDGDRRVQAANNSFRTQFGMDGEILDQLGGEVLHCINQEESHCGTSTACRGCKVKSTAEEAMIGHETRRIHTDLQVRRNGDREEMQLMISAAPFEYEGEQLAVVLLEDISELSTLRTRLKEQHSFAGIIGKDPKMQDLFETIKEVKDINVPIHIYGKSGTGKELVASAIHNEGIRASMPFVPVNCAALPEGVLESELFGHVRGAFTGAIRDKKGRFELADGGTLFLDEVAEMPPVLQAKLLRVLQEGRFERVGDEKSVSVDVRLISATNKDLKEEVEQGNFREDLYYRLNVVPVDIPALCERRGDIPLLVEQFIERAKRTGQKSLGISPETVARLIDYPWPGNIRELQSVIQFALIKARGGIIEPGHLSPQFHNGTTPRPSTIPSQPSPAVPRPSQRLSMNAINDALAQTGGNKVKAAKLLGVGRATLYRFLSANQ